MSTTGKLIAIEESTHAKLKACADRRRQPIKVVASSIIESYFRRQAALIPAKVRK
jgi:hypothetical protein